MERAQQELVGVLLDYIRSLGLISSTAFGQAMDLAHSAALPPFFQEDAYECAQNSQ